MFSSISAAICSLFRPTHSHSHIVPKIVVKTALLELAKDEFVFLAPPTPEVYGSVSLTGNSLPTFHYTVFDSRLMDFVLVRIEVALPARVSFVAKLIPTQNRKTGSRYMPELDPELVEIPSTPAYEAPGRKLLKYLGDYFPLIKESV